MPSVMIIYPDKPIWADTPGEVVQFEVSSGEANFRINNPTKAQYESIVDWCEQYIGKFPKRQDEVWSVNYLMLAEAKFALRGNKMQPHPYSDTGLRPFLDICMSKNNGMMFKLVFC